MTFVVTDSLMLHRIPAGCDARCFTILSDSSLNDLREFAKQFMAPGNHSDITALAVTKL